MEGDGLTAAQRRSGQVEQRRSRLDGVPVAIAVALAAATAGYVLGSLVAGFAIPQALLLVALAASWLCSATLAFWPRRSAATPYAEVERRAIDPVSGLLWESEHGPTGGDEVNVIQKGHNYGWGVISMGLQPGIDHQHQAGMEDPITYYTPSIGPSGMSFYTAGRYPGWKNSLFLSALAGQKLIRYEVSGSKITHEEVVYKGFGRTRDVITGPDGYLYILIQNSQSLSNSPGMVIRLMPVE